MFGEQLAAVLGEDFPNNSSMVSTDQSNTSSPTFPLDYFDYATTRDDVPNISNSVNNDNNPGYTFSPQETQVARQSSRSDLHDTDDHQSDKGNKYTSRDGKKQQQEEETANGDRSKRKREANQAQAHIMAERKRRELLGQRFIALSTIIPDLKKTDKMSVLGEAIKYLRQLQEKVKNLEEVVAKHTVESLVVKKSQVIIDNDDGGSGGAGDNDSSSFNVDSNNNNNKDSLPQIEVKVSGKTLLFRVYCEKEKGTFTKLFCELEKHGITVVNANVYPFGALALDITILAQMEMGLDMNMKEIIRSIHATLQPEASS
uniref:BHLH domain-containing protein n=1 Tax=Opuntia streptacantha TaxID=393608 RepID=A0A7C9A3Y8_OPUST